MSAADELTAKIHATIPLSAAMQFSIDHLDQDDIRVSAPLPPNINIHGTGFAGSLYSIAVLTGWALCMHIIDESGIDAELVVARAEIAYRAPVKSVIECRCSASLAQREVFLREFHERGKGRIMLDIAVGDLPQASLHATFVALARN
ncbi:MAG: thioesterase domain-containing protein [Gammaproteobacteria bacterium]|jgi:thioesterase domain-containing protein|nr:thioesterase domain-containing protein [Gammaproteobacteria bacterium]